MAKVRELDMLTKIFKSYSMACCLMALILLLTCNSALSQSRKRGKPKMQEASGNFDLENVQPFLKRLKPLIEFGFSDEEINQIQKSLESMEVDDEKDFEFQIKFKGQSSVLKIHVFMDDIESPDVAFFAVPELEDKIDEEMQRFFEELGI
jgi:hypothetical protein